MTNVFKYNFGPTKAPPPGLPVLNLPGSFGTAFDGIFGTFATIPIVGPALRWTGNQIVEIGNDPVGAIAKYLILGAVLKTTAPVWVPLYKSIIKGITSVGKKLRK